MTIQEKENKEKEIEMLSAGISSLDADIQKYRKFLQDEKERKKESERRKLLGKCFRTTDEAIKKTRHAGAVPLIAFKAIAQGTDNPENYTCLCLMGGEEKEDSKRYSIELYELPLWETAVTTLSGHPGSIMRHEEISDEEWQAMFFGWQEKILGQKEV